MSPPKSEKVSALLFSFIEFFTLNEEIVVLNIRIVFLKINDRLPLLDMERHGIERIGTEGEEKFCSAEETERLMKIKSWKNKSKIEIISLQGESWILLP